MYYINFFTCKDSCFVIGPFDGARRRLKKHSKPELNLPVILTEARTEIPVNENEIGDQNDQAMLDLGELNAVVQQKPPAIELDHDYHTGASYWGQAYKDVNAICIQQKKTIQKLKRQLELSTRRLSKYKSGNLPKKFIKKICIENLTGKGKCLSETQVIWMLETTEDKPRERASFCKGKIRNRYVLFFSFLTLAIKSQLTEKDVCKMG